MLSEVRPVPGALKRPVPAASKDEASAAAKRPVRAAEFKAAASWIIENLPLRAAASVEKRQAGSLPDAVAKSPPAYLPGEIDVPEVVAVGDLPPLPADVDSMSNADLLGALEVAAMYGRKDEVRRITARLNPELTDEELEEHAALVYQLDEDEAELQRAVAYYKRLNQERLLTQREAYYYRQLLGLHARWIAAAA